MNNKRKAKKILRAFGKEAYRARIEYVNSFLPEKVSYVRSISYRHALRRAAIVALVLIMVMALAVSAYAAVKYYLNYTKVVHPDNDEYVANSEYDSDVEASFLTPTYVPEGYHLNIIENSEPNNSRTWIYQGEENESLIILQYVEGANFHIDNERSTSSTMTICDMEVMVYDFSDEILAVMQHEKMVIVIKGQLGADELEEIVRGMLIAE